MTTAQLEIHRADLRAIARLVQQDLVASAIGELAALLADSDDLDVRTLGVLLQDADLGDIADAEGC